MESRRVFFVAHVGTMRMSWLIIGRVMYFTTDSTPWPKTCSSPPRPQPQKYVHQVQRRRRRPWQHRPPPQQEEEEEAAQQAPPTSLNFILHYPERIWKNHTSQLDQSAFITQLTKRTSLLSLTFKTNSLKKGFPLWNIPHSAAIQGSVLICFAWIISVFAFASKPFCDRLVQVSSGVMILRWQQSYVSSR